MAKKTGRPRSAMTPDKVQAILKAVSLGVWPDRAAEMAGVSPSTMRAMRKRDPEFATALKRAEATAESGIHGKILRHMDKHWQACAWMLERRWPKRWRRVDDPVRMKMEASVQQSGPPLPEGPEGLASFAEAFAAAASTLRMPEKDDGGTDATPGA